MLSSDKPTGTNDERWIGFILPLNWPALPGICASLLAKRHSACRLKPSMYYARLTADSAACQQPSSSLMTRLIPRHSRRICLERPAPACPMYVYSHHRYTACLSFTGKCREHRHHTIILFQRSDDENALLLLGKLSVYQCWPVLCSRGNGPKQDCYFNVK